MALITKQEKQQGRLGMVTHYIELLDRYLRQGQGVGMSINYDAIPVPYDLHDKFIEEAAKAGWTIKFNSDQREGTWWSVS